MDHFRNATEFWERHWFVWISLVKTLFTRTLRLHDAFLEDEVEFQNQSIETRLLKVVLISEFLKHSATTYMWIPGKITFNDSGCCSYINYFSEVSLPRYKTNRLIAQWFDIPQKYNPSETENAFLLICSRNYTPGLKRL